MDVSDAQIVDGGALGIGRVNVELAAIVEFYIAFDIHGKGGPGQNLNLNAIFQLELAINENGYIAADLDDCVVAPFELINVHSTADGYRSSVMYITNTGPQPGWLGDRGYDDRVT